MIVTTAGFNREFYAQTGEYSLETSFSIPNTTANCSLGVSGAAGVAQLTIKNGKIYDNQNRYIWAYPTDQPIDIKLNVSHNAYDVYIEGTPVIFADSKFDGKSTHFFFNTDQDIEDFNYSIKGYVPQYTYSDNIVFSTDSTSITGYLTNLDSEILKIYSGHFEGDTSSFDITWTAADLNASESGMFVISVNQEGLAGSHILESTLFTNFGVIPLNINLSGSLPAVVPYSISLYGASEIVLGYDSNYYGEFYSNEGELLMVPILQHVQGSGQTFLTIPISGGYSQSFTGYLAESGYLYSPVNLVGSGSGGGFGLSITDTINQIEKSFAWATGPLSQSVTVVGSGYVGVPGYTGFVTGAVNSTLNGTVGPGSGSLYFDTQLTATLPTVYTASPVRFNPATGAIYYNTPLNAVTSDIIYINSLNHGIVYGFHHKNIDELVSYINANSGIHGVTGFKSDSNTVKLGTVLNYTAQPVLLLADADNDGNMAVSNTGMLGGAIFGLGSGISLSTSVTGNYKGSIKNSGNYNEMVNGTAYGSGVVLDTERTFESAWNLFSGKNYFEMTDYKANGFYNTSGFASPDPISSSKVKSLYLKVSYSDYDSRVTDVARLILSGIGPAAGYYAEIYITGRNE